MKKTSIITVFLMLGGVVMAGVPSWGLGPFVRPDHVNPIVSPNTNAVFNCPMRGRPVRWEALHTFNPAAVVKGDEVCLLYRAEDDSGANMIGAHTSRLGLGISRDGLHFRTLPHPVVYPAEDSQKTNEWTGGCEDPRLVETTDGTFVLTYTQWNHKHAQLAIATSKDMLHWKKYGPAFVDFTGHSKSGAIVCRLSDGPDRHLVAAKINGKYWMYWGEGTVYCASSDDLIHWHKGEPVLRTRAGKFDSGLVEGGPPAVLTDQGIVMIYNGKNDPAKGDPSLPPNVYSAGQALFSATNPRHLLARMDKPFFKPETAIERSGQYAGGTTFTEGLVYFKSKWFLYYGCADSYVSVAVCSEGH